jgi:perosamine synthetase
VRNGETVRAFEEAFASYVGAKYAIALCNGTATLHTGLLALGVKPGDRVAVPPLTMSATTMAVLHAGAVPVFVDVDPQTWLMRVDIAQGMRDVLDIVIPVSLYGLHQPWQGRSVIDDAAQTLRPYGCAGFTSYSFQASKILSTGEGGMLVTDSEELATRARSISSLGYRMDPKQPRIDPATLKSPTFDRHHTFPAWNYRMSDVTAAEGLRQLGPTNSYVSIADTLKYARRQCAEMYREAHAGCAWLTPQHVPLGWGHDMWSYAVACDTPERALWLQAKMAELGAEIPYGAWRLTYHEKPFRQLGNALDADDFTKGDDWVPMGVCPVAENLQPRLLQFQTNDLRSAERNARALRRAIEEAA